MESASNDIKQKIREYKKRYYINQLIKGGIFFLSTILSLFLIANFIEYLAELPSIGRSSLFYVFLLLFTYTFSIWIIIPLYKLYKLDHYLSDEDAAKQIGQYFKSIDDNLLNTLQLNKQIGTENTLVLESIKQRTNDLRKFNFVTAISIDKNKHRFARYLAVPLIVIFSIWVTYPSLISQPSRRILNHQITTTKKNPYGFNLLNESRKGYYNEPLEINCQLLSKNKFPNQVFIIIDGKKRLLQNEFGSIFKTLINNPINDLTVQFEANNFKSNTFKIPIVRRPALKKLTAELHYPSYIVKTNQSIENTGTFSIPEGTKVKWNVKSDYTNYINFTFDTVLLAATKNNNNYSLSKSFFKSIDYKIDLINSEAKNKDSLTYSITIIKDRYPKIKSKEFEDDNYYNYLFLGGSIEDDYGFSNLKIFYKSEFDENFKSISIKINRAQKTQNFHYQLPIGKVQKGSTIEYYLTVTDNDAVNGPKTTSTSLLHYEIPGQEIINQKRKEQESKTSQTFINTSKESDELKNQIEMLKDNLKGKKKLNWEEKNEVQKLIDKHKAHDQKIKELQQQINSQESQQNRFEKNNEKLNKKINQLSALMDELLDDDTKKLMEELEELLDEDVSEIQKKLNEIQDKDKKLEKEIDRALELYKELKFEVQLKKNIDLLDSLQKQQQQLAEKNEKDRKLNQKASEKQRHLTKDFEVFKEQMEELEHKNNDLKKPHDLYDFENELKEISENQEESAQQLEQNNRKKGSQHQKKASKQMNELKKSLQNQQQQIASKQAEENLNNLEHLLDNLLTLSHNQESLTEKFKETQQRDPRFVELSQQQVELNKSAVVVEDSLYALASRVFQIKHYITEELTSMVRHMNSTTDALKSRMRNQSLKKQRYAQTSMNNLALLLDDLLQQMQQQMANKKPGEQMCNKPGSGNKPNLSQMQEQLNQTIEKLKEGQKKGRKTSKNIAKMAAQQQMIRDGLRELQKKDSHSKDLQEQLQELKNLMQKSEEDLINKDFTNELFERQKQITTKLLSAENAIQKQEYENKRESKIADQQAIPTPDRFEEYINQKKRQIELIKTIPLELKPYYKEEVNKYYQKIN